MSLQICEMFHALISYLESARAPIKIKRDKFHVIVQRDNLFIDGPNVKFQADSGHESLYEFITILNENDLLRYLKYNFETKFPQNLFRRCKRSSASGVPLLDSLYMIDDNFYLESFFYDKQYKVTIRNGHICIDKAEGAHFVKYIDLDLKYSTLLIDTLNEIDGTLKHLYEYHESLLGALPVRIEHEFERSKKNK